MQLTYKAVLHRDRVEWLEPPPDLAHPVHVEITLVEDVSRIADAERGKAMAEALAGLASVGGFFDIADPVAWQRQVREA